MDLSNLDVSAYFQSKLSVTLSVGAATLACFVAYKANRNDAFRKAHTSATPSPLKTKIAKLSDQEVSSLPYPPDVLPGARDVDTPYGSIRVYEWGPEKGRKVLLVHGISTPCLSLAGVALKLVEKGCRVMTFDLFGRGYSDNPQALPHDTRLYTTQILLVLASSPLSWTGGANTFDLVGYSLGGGIGIAFTAYYPHLVNSLIAIAPSGIIREKHIGGSSKFLYQTEGILPEALIHRLVKRRLAAGPLKPPKPGTEAKDDYSATTHTVEPEDAVEAETTGEKKPTDVQEAYRKASLAIDQAAPLFPHRPLITVPASVSWQLDAHEGFVAAFISAIRYAPVTGCHWMWARIGARLTAQKGNSADKELARQGLLRSKVLMVLGRDDSIIVKEEVEADAVEAIGGRNNIEIVVLECGHEVPITKSREVVRAAMRFWGEDEDDEGEEDAVEVEFETGT